MNSNQQPSACFDRSFQRLRIFALSCVLLSALLLGLPSRANADADSPKPSDLYRQYHKQLLAASSVDEIKPFLCKKVVADIDGTPAPMKPMMFGLLQTMTPKDVLIVSENIDGDKATLTLKSAEAEKKVEGVSETTKGTVTLVREGALWKIDKETWDSKFVSKGAPDQISAPDKDK